MADQIKDGTGGAYLAGVSSSNRLEVSARVNERIYYASRDDKKAFVVQFHHTQAVGGVVAGCGYIEYTGSNRLNVKQVTISSEDAGMGKFGVWESPTVSGGAAKIPVNLNFGSTLTSETTCKEGADGTLLNITGGNSLYTVRTDGVQTIVLDFYDAIILGPNNVIGFRSNAATTGTKTRINVMFHESIE